MNEKTIYDFELAEDCRELSVVLSNINAYGHRIVSVTQDDGMYTVIFERKLNG